MAINTQTIRIDLNTGRSIPVAYSHQGDTARSFVFEVYNNGEAFPLAGYTAKIAAMLPADNGYRVIAGDNMADGVISENTITATLPADFTAKPGRGVLTIVLTGSGATIRPINIDLRIQKSADAPETIAGASDFVPVLQRYMAEDMQTYINAWLDAHPEAMQYYISGSKLVLDENGILSIQNDTDEIVEALDLDTLRAEVTDLKSDLESLEGGVLSNEAKTVLLRCFQNVAWINDQGQTYYDSLYAALYPPADLVSIRAAFNQGSAVIFDTDSLDTLKQYLTVTAIMSDSTTRTVTNYTLSGTLTVGTSTITVSYGGKTTTFNVTVTASPLLPFEYQHVEYIANSSNAYIVTSIPIPLGYTVHGKAYLSAKPSQAANVCGGDNRIATTNWANVSFCCYSAATANRAGTFYGSTNCFDALADLYASPLEFTTVHTASDISINLKNSGGEKSKTVSQSDVVAVDALNVFRASSGAPNPFTGRIYLLEVLDTNNHAVANLIPCYRKADNVVGMYDIIGNAFYTSANSTAFTKGADV